MMRKNSFSIFVSTLLIVGFFILAMPEKGFTGCCQTLVLTTGDIYCHNTSAAVCSAAPNGTYTLTYYPDKVCSSNLPGIPSFCESSLGAPSPSPVTSVPTLSEWGLISMAGLLGIVGFIVIRRRKVTA